MKKNTLKTLGYLILLVISQRNLKATPTAETPAQKAFQATMTDAQQAAARAIEVADNTLAKKMKTLEDAYKKAIDKASQEYANTLKSIQDRFDQIKKNQQKKYAKETQK